MVTSNPLPPQSRSEKLRNLVSDVWRDFGVVLLIGGLAAVVEEDVRLPYLLLVTVMVLALIGYYRRLP